MRFSVCFHPNRHKEQNSPHRRGRAVLSAPLVCLTACQGDPTRGPGLNETLLWAWEQATNARSGAVSWGKPSFFHPETRQTWPRQSFWNVFQTFYNCRNTFFPLTGQVQFTLKWKLKYPEGKSTGVPCPHQHDDDWTQNQGNQGNQVTFVVVWHWDKLLLDSPGWTWCLRCVSNPL